MVAPWAVCSKAQKPFQREDFSYDPRCTKHNLHLAFSQKALSEPSSPILVARVSLGADSKDPNSIVPKDRRMEVCKELSFQRKQE